MIAWLKRYLAGDSAVNTGPGFEWLADDAQWRSAAGYPLPAAAPLVATGSGTLVMQPGRRRLRHGRPRPGGRRTRSTWPSRRPRARPSWSASRS